MTTITVDEFKTRFAKNFIFGIEDNEVSDNDITNAITDALSVFNQDLLSTDEEGINISKNAFYYLVAHFCQLNYDEIIGGSQPSLLQSSRSVGGMSESLQIPDWISNSELSIYATTSFGLKYLQIIKSYLIGVAHVVGGYTIP